MKMTIAQNPRSRKGATRKKNWTKNLGIRKKTENTERVLNSFLNIAFSET